MRFEFKVLVEADRVSGKFASRDELTDYLRDELEGADPGAIAAEDGGEYEITEWDVSEVTA